MASRMTSRLLSAGPLGLLVALTALAPDQANAQVSACSTCVQTKAPASPASGAWFTPDEPGTGFLLNFQGSRIGGTWFGFDEQGAPQWYLIAGDLLRSEPGAESLWHAEMPLFRYVGGACLGCDFRAAEELGGPRIRIEFDARNAGRFSVDGRPWRRLESLTFGADTEKAFAPAVTYPFPDMDGMWAFVVTSPGAAPDSGYLRHSVVTGTPGATHSATDAGGLVEVAFRLVSPGPGNGETDRDPAVTLECAQAQRDTVVNCFVMRHFSLPRSISPMEPEARYTLRLEDIGVTRFKAEAADGGTIEAFRVEFD